MGLHFSEGRLIYFTLVLVVSLVGTMCSIALIVIVTKMQIWNVNTRLILVMTLGQLMYDICFIHHGVYLISDSDAYFISSIVLDVLGVAGSYVTYCCSCVLCYSVVHLFHFSEVFVVRNYRALIIAVISIPILVLFVTTIYFFYSLATGEDNYFLLDDILFAFVVLRIIPIVLNVIFIFIVLYNSYFIYNSNSVLSVHEKAISVLVGRLMWYPIIIVANRFFPFWYDLEFPNYEDDGYNMTNTYKYTINILGIISPIIAPIGFLTIYLIMYPRALKFVRYKVVSSIQSLNDGFLWMSSSGYNTNDVTSKKNRSTEGWHSDSSSGVDRERGGEEKFTTNTRLSSSSSHQLRTTNDLHRHTQTSIHISPANESSNFTSTHTNESSSQESVEPNINPSENEPEDGGDYDNDGRDDGGNILSSDGSDLRTISISELSNKNRVLSTNSAELLIDNIQWDQLRDEDLIKLIDKEIKDLKVKPTTISSVPLGNIPQNRNSVVGRDSIINSNLISGGNRSFSNHNNSLTNSLSFADHNRQSTASNNSIKSRSLASSGGNSFTLNPLADENHRAVP